MSSEVTTGIIEGQIVRHWVYALRTENGTRLTARGSDGSPKLSLLIEEATGHAAALEVYRDEFDEWAALVRSTVPVAERNSDPNLATDARSPSGRDQAP